MFTKAIAGAATLALAALSSGWVLGTDKQPDPWDTRPGVGTALSSTDLRDGKDTASRSTTREPLPTDVPTAQQPTADAGPTEAPAEALPTEATAPVPAAQDSAPAAQAPSADDLRAAAAAAAAQRAAAPTTQQPATQQPPAQQPAPTDRASAYAADLVAGVNAERARAGLSALAPNACAQASAQDWAQHLVATSTFEHQQMRAVMTRCSVRAAGENIAMSPGSPGQMVAMWMDSTGHRENILRPEYTGIGSAAVLNSRGYWVAVHVFVVG